MLPLISESEPHSFAAIHASTSRRIVPRQEGPWRMITETNCRTSAPAIVPLMTSTAVCTPPVIASDEFTRPERKVRRVGKFHPAQHLELHHIEIDFVKTREEHDAISAGLIDLNSEVCERRKQRRKLHRHGNVYFALDLLHNLDHLPLNVGRRCFRIAGGVVEVKLDCVRTRLFHQMSVGQPAAERAAI